MCVCVCFNSRPSSRPRAPRPSYLGRPLAPTSSSTLLCLHASTTLSTWAPLGTRVNPTTTTPPATRVNPTNTTPPATTLPPSRVESITCAFRSAQAPTGARVNSYWDGGSTPPDMSFADASAICVTWVPMGTMPILHLRRVVHLRDACAHKRTPLFGTGGGPVCFVLASCSLSKQRSLGLMC